MKQLFSVYSNTVLPMYGKLISKDQSAYSYLNKTIEAFPQGEVMMEVFKRQDSQRQSSSDSPSASAHSISQPNKIKYYGQVWTHRLPSGAFVLKNYFNEKFENEAVDAQYINFEIPSIENLTEILDSNPELKGLNVTIPYKEKVISYLDVVSPEANAIGAVNVIKVEHRGEDVYLKGYNSDVIGFTKSIEPYIEPYHKKALILGTGGASKAINFGLKSLGLETVFVSRYERPGTIQYEKSPLRSSKSIMSSLTAPQWACIHT